MATMKTETAQNQAARNQGEEVTQATAHSPSYNPEKGKPDLESVYLPEADQGNSPNSAAALREQVKNGALSPTQMEELLHRPDLPAELRAALVEKKAAEVKKAKA